MLSQLLKKEQCALCGFCCSFRRQSLWELPRLPLEFTQEHRTGYNGESVKYRIETSGGDSWAVTDIRDRYASDDPDEEVRCPFLDPQNGCILPPGEKPFECSAWPLRYMRMQDGSTRVCLTPTCPVINRVDTVVMKELADSKWNSAFREYAKEHPYIIKDYKEGFTVL